MSFFCGDISGETVVFGGELSSGDGDALGLRFLLGPGLIGRTGSINSDRRRENAVGAGCGVAEDSGASLAAGDALALGSGDAVGLGDGDAVGLGAGEAVEPGAGDGLGVIFFLAAGVDFLRCL
jgi:hypothetical protein